MSTGDTFPDLRGAATGVGSLPGTDAREAAKTSTGALEQLPFLPELPARGPGADMIGRGAGLLVELFAQTEPSGWRFADRPGRDTRRAHSWLGEDLDALEEFTQGYQGALKLQAVGPWTLAASIELRHGEKALSDHGACRDIAGSLTEGLRRHLADVRRRVPGAQLVLQLDEPSLPAVLAGSVKTASGFQRLRSVDRQVAEEVLRETIRGLDVPVVVHCCAPQVPLPLLRRAGAAGVSSTSPSSPSGRTTTSARRSRRARRSSLVSCPPLTRRCPTRPVVSRVSGPCGAGSGSPRSCWAAACW